MYGLDLIVHLFIAEHLGIGEEIYTENRCFYGANSKLKFKHVSKVSKSKGRLTCSQQVFFVITVSRVFVLWTKLLRKSEAHTPRLHLQI